MEWLVHSHNINTSGFDTYNFSTSQSLTQIVSSPTLITDRASDGSYLLDLFLCSNVLLTVLPLSCLQLVTRIIPLFLFCVSYSSFSTPVHPFHRTVSVWERWLGWISFISCWCAMDLSLYSWSWYGCRGNIAMDSHWYAHLYSLTDRAGFMCCGALGLRSTRGPLRAAAIFTSYMLIKVFICKCTNLGWAKEKTTVYV